MIGIDIIWPETDSERAHAQLARFRPRCGCV